MSSQYRSVPSTLGEDVYEGDALSGILMDNKKNLPAKLGEGIRELLLPGGHRVAAFTDARFGERTNQDCIAIDVKRQRITVNDGHGENGHFAAQRLGYLQVVSTSFEEAVEQLRSEIRQTVWKRTGVCTAQAWIGQKTNSSQWGYQQIGDIKLVCAELPMSGSKPGKRQIIHESKDDTVAQMLHDFGHITADQVLVHKERHTVISSVGRKEPSIRTENKLPNLTSGQRLYIYSDGIGDNLRVDDILDLAEKLSPAEAIEAIIDVSTKRMQWVLDEAARDVDENEIQRQTRLRRAGELEVFGDGYKPKPKPDNRAIAIIDIV